ncbi:unnamed protein product [Calicophoron daubneyi]|uniref:protein-serine/threonine phosphatase n=1 Tax=Calicophoron daubneyi TaxID=300641 RepID=A0AAV2TIM4_CALDB
MSLITIDRSLFAASSDGSEDLSENVAVADSGQDPPDNSSKSSQSEDFMMCKATAVGLNIRSRRRSSYIKPNDDMQDHLKRILGILRFGDYIQLVVRLQSERPRPHRHRYCCVISTNGKQSTEESAVLGVDITDRRATIGLVLPIWQDMSVNLCGDGGFELITKDTEKQFKPVSVQALWAAFQAVNRACQVARTNAYYSRGLTHDWVSYYHNLPASDTQQIQEWLKTDDIDSFNRCTPLSPLSKDATEAEKERAQTEALIRIKLQEIMYVVDLEDITVLQLRERLEDELEKPLREYRHFIEQEVLSIYGRMDEASLIFDHLLLGTTFNASNRDELERRNVTHILNVTREVDNFFPGDKYEYKNIRVFDDEQSSLLPYFEETHRFINEAKQGGTCCLVHCKMGISRSATVVVAYVMKEQNWDLETALSYVKCRRPCVQPNQGFMKELRTYQGILEASANRHKACFCKELNEACSRSSGQLGDGSGFIPVKVSDPSAPAPTSLSAHSSHSLESFAAVARNESPDRLANRSPTPTPISDHQISDPVDLEAELFAYKQCDHARFPYSERSPSAVLRPLHGAMNISSENTNSVPYVVWDLGEVNTSDLSPDDHSTVVARNSHCLRQWHPDLVENVSQTDLALLTINSGKRAPPIHRAETSFVCPFQHETVEPLAEVDPIKPQPLADGFTHPITVDDDICVVSPPTQPTPYSVALVQSPVTLYTSLVLPSEPMSSPTPEASIGKIVDEPDSDPVRPSFVLRMASMLSDLKSTKQSETKSTTGDDITLRNIPHTSPVRCVTSPSGRNRSPNPAPNTNVESTLQIPSSFWRSSAHNYSSDCSPPDSDPTVQLGIREAAIICPADSGVDQTERDLQQSSSGSTRSNTPVVLRSQTLRSARPPSDPQQTGVINRAQSARTSTNHAFSSRLRPDNSWIIGASAVTPTDTTNLNPSNTTSKPVRPVSALLSAPCPDSLHVDSDESAQFHWKPVQQNAVNDSAFRKICPAWTHVATRNLALQNPIHSSPSSSTQVKIDPSSILSSRSCPLFPSSVELGGAISPVAAPVGSTVNMEEASCDRPRNSPYLTYGSLGHTADAVVAKSFC